MGARFHFRARPPLACCPAGTSRVLMPIVPGTAAQMRAIPCEAPRAWRRRTARPTQQLDIDEKVVRSFYGRLPPGLAQEGEIPLLSLLRFHGFERRH